MANIKILPDIVASKIAAGEVIERPASVVKELVENSIDAGSARIVVDIEGGGGRLIRVSDDGTGMSRENALLSIERHATSKIENISDIENILTLGFRGEALPSIVSVSKTVIDTKRKDDVFGTRLIINGGVLRDVTDVGRDEGTVVEVKNLFFNLPARRKFMRSENTELKYIKGTLYDVAVSSPGLSLTLNSHGREIFSFKGCKNRQEMLRQIFGETMTKLMIPLKFTAEGIEVEGFIGKPETARKTGYHQYIIMNGRPVRSKSIARAVLNGYGQTLIKGMFPLFVIYFETDPSRIDVNVHPSKREIRIHREFALFQALSENILQTIQSMHAAPELGTAADSFIKPERYGALNYTENSGTPITVYNPPDDRWHPELPSFKGSSDSTTQQDIQTTLSFSKGELSDRTGILSLSGEKEGIQYEATAFWQLKDRYIITTTKEGAIIIDQHVAHERILFEEILEHFKGKQASAQQLLFPLMLDFSAADYDIIEPMIPFLNQIGFGVNNFGERSVMVDAVPSWHRGSEDGTIFSEFIDEMREHGKITSGYIEKLAAAVACRAAIKSGKPLAQEEMQYLVDRLFATSSPFVCPHGRPVIVKLTLEELDRRFGRI
ncbi:MAG: DNA mismatch repair endonuclease MutL [Candidatus Latescibacteria bacterium]|jgi:DNA mismatch repair protein MutL|nr:DNA mismatch repair endonuclease MutL [Candidatus Latescibacterota bacterium]